VTKIYNQMTFIKKIFKFLLLLVFSISKGQNKDINILVFSKTEAFRHKSIPVGINFLKEMALKNNWKNHFTEDASVFKDSILKNYDLIVFLNTSGNILNDTQKAALKQYFARGRGFVGIHAASDTEKEWKWYTEMVGAVFKDHPKVQPASLLINKNSNHPAISTFKEKEIFNDEWYNFLNPVGKHVTVLASLDENSYEGNKMNMNHPISWCHIYDGSKVFYTGLGHTLEIYSDPRFYNHIQQAILWASGRTENNVKPSNKWENLLEDDLYKNWDVYIGAPHSTVKGLEGVDPNSNGINATPLGLNNDPKKVFTIENIGGEKVVHISGEIYGSITTKKEYQNYHLKLQFKWGDKVWEPRLKDRRDSGILYHCFGPYQGFWNVWMQSQELQVQEGDVGDYYGLTSVLIDIPSEKKEGEEEYTYKEQSTINEFSCLKKYPSNHCNKGFNNEKKHGEWNTVELICFGGTSLHIVNGKVVMILYNSRYNNLDNQILPLTKGRIQIQSEAAEVFYKDIQIKSITEIPKPFKKMIKVK
jgi:type 1 glutamine amidotransferase